MVLQGYVARVKARFGPFGDSANLDAGWVHSFAPNVPLCLEIISEAPDGSLR
jgi:hypothetical protein